MSVSHPYTTKQNLGHDNIPKGASKGAATPTGAVLTKDITSSNRKLILYRDRIGSCLEIVGAQFFFSKTV